LVLRVVKEKEEWGTTVKGTEEEDSGGVKIG
jgi:hypothetical protein